MKCIHYQTQRVYSPHRKVSGVWVKRVGQGAKGGRTLRFRGGMA